MEHDNENDLLLDSQKKVYQYYYIAYYFTQ